MARYIIVPCFLGEALCCLSQWGWFMECTVVRAPCSAPRWVWAKMDRAGPGKSTCRSPITSTGAKRKSSGWPPSIQMYDLYPGMVEWLRLLIQVSRCSKCLKTHWGMKERGPPGTRISAQKMWGSSGCCNRQWEIQDTLIWQDIPKTSRSSIRNWRRKIFLQVRFLLHYTVRKTFFFFWSSYYYYSFLYCFRATLKFCLLTF